jgi:hypothetical protein
MAIPFEEVLQRAKEICEKAGYSWSIKRCTPKGRPLATEGQKRDYVLDAEQQLIRERSQHDESLI